MARALPYSRPLVKELTDDPVTLQEFSDENSLCFQIRRQVAQTEAGQEWSKYSLDCYTALPLEDLNSLCLPHSSLSIPTPTSKEEYESALQNNKQWSDRNTQAVADFAADLRKSSDPTLKNVGVWIASEDLMYKIKTGEISIPKPSQHGLVTSDYTSGVIEEAIRALHLLPSDPGSDAGGEIDSDDEERGVDALVRSKLGSSEMFHKVLEDGNAFRLGIKTNEGWNSLVGPKEAWAKTTNRLTMHATVAQELIFNAQYLDATNNGQRFEVGVKTGTHWDRLFDMTPPDEDSRSDDSEDSEDLGGEE